MQFEALVHQHDQLDDQAKVIHPEQTQTPDVDRNVPGDNLGGIKDRPVARLCDSCRRHGALCCVMARYSVERAHMLERRTLTPALGKTMLRVTLTSAPRLTPC